MSKIVVLDIETIPDPAAVARAGVEVGEGFLSWPLHSLACASVFTVARQGMGEPHFSIETYFRRNSGERGIVAAVEHSLANATVVTFNGRGFDVPVLLARAAICGEAAPNLGDCIAKIDTGGDCTMTSWIRSRALEPPPGQSCLTSAQLSASR